VLDHQYCFGEVSGKSNPLEKGYKYRERVVEPLGAGGPEHSIICIEEWQEVSDSVTDAVLGNVGVPDC
jgi:hypothetical protein